MELDESARYALVTKGALSFNDSPEAAIKSAKNEYERIRKERGGARKGQKFIKNRGANVRKFVFPAGCVLISEKPIQDLKESIEDVDEYNPEDCDDEFWIFAFLKRLQKNKNNAWR